jgi:hypothetical protein
MCIPIELDVPVLTIDLHEIGTAREILCACPGDDGSATPTAGAVGGVLTGNDLWLRVERTDGPDLFVPFGEIVETRPDGVSLRTRSDDLRLQLWERHPNGIALPFAVV